MFRSLSFIAALSIAVPATAADDPVKRAETRLNSCLLTGSSAAPQTTLREAVISVRSFCGTQIKRVQRHRVQLASNGLAGDAKKPAEDRAIRALNNEIAVTIANFTGLKL